MRFGVRSSGRALRGSGFLDMGTLIARVDVLLRWGNEVGEWSILELLGLGGFSMRIAVTDIGRLEKGSVFVNRMSIIHCMLLYRTYL